MMSDQNLYVLEVRTGIILYLNQRTAVEDGWWWGTDDEFVQGPFMNYESAVADARRRNAGDLNLIVWNKDTFGLSGEPSPNGNLIVIDTGGHLWVRDQERPVNAPVQ
jgi:hypothetical protein